MTALARYRFVRDVVFFLGALGLILFVTVTARAEPSLLNVSYDPTRELFKAMNHSFAEAWKKKTGSRITIKMSHGGSGKQARAVIDGLDASVVTLALAADIDEIARQTGKIPADWQKRLPNNATPFTSTIVFLVRKGNPKGIKDWDDLARPGVQVITPNPKTSGGARWNYLAAWGYAAEKNKGDEKVIRDFMTALFRNVPVLDTGARGATITFAQRGLGDALVAWENEAFLSLSEFGADKFEIVVPSVSILAEPPVALVEGNLTDENREAAKSYLDFLYSDEAQALAAKNFYRPSRPEAAAKADLERFTKVRMLTVGEAFGGWAAAQKAHFAEGAAFDQILTSIKR